MQAMTPEENPADLITEESLLRGLCDWIDSQDDTADLTPAELKQANDEVERHMRTLLDRTADPADVPMIVPAND